MTGWQACCQLYMIQSSAKPASSLTCSWLLCMQSQLSAAAIIPSTSSSLGCALHQLHACCLIDCIVEGCCLSHQGHQTHHSIASCHRHLQQLVQACSSVQALREHCSLSGHDPSKVPKSSKQKHSLAPVQSAVPLELSVQPVPDQVEMDRYVWPF